jgi:ribonuclease HI
LLALQRSVDLGAKRVKIVTDSQLMARQWVGLYKVKNLSIKRLFQEAKQFAEKLEDVQVIHVNRTENIEADKLVNEVIDQNV